MTGFTVSFADETAVKLNNLAERLRITPEELIRTSVEDMLASPTDSLDKDAFKKATEYVLEKNSELYKRLAV